MIAVFGSIAVALMLLAYALEARSRWFVALVALRRFAVRRGAEMRPDTP